jgi:hypothetical protein
MKPTARVHRVGFELLEVPWDGQQVPAPMEPSSWFRIDFGWFHGINEPAAIEEVILPSSLDRIGFRQRGRASWVELGESRKAAEYADLVEGLTPFSAETFPSGLGVKTPGLTPTESDAAGLPWLPLAAALGVVASAGGFFLVRRRR